MKKTQVKNRKNQRSVGHLPETRRVAERTCFPRFSITISIDPSSSPGCISNLVLVLLGILDESTNFSVSNHAKQAHWRMPLECQRNLQKIVSVLSSESFFLDYKAHRPCRHRLQKFNETQHIQHDCIPIFSTFWRFNAGLPNF